MKCLLKKEYWKRLWRSLVVCLELKIQVNRVIKMDWDNCPVQIKKVSIEPRREKLVTVTEIASGQTQLMRRKRNQPIITWPKSTQPESTAIACFQPRTSIRNWRVPCDGLFFLSYKGSSTESQLSTGSDIGFLLYSTSHQNPASHCRQDIQCQTKMV